MLVDHNVIGGTSLPNYKEMEILMAGGVFSIQGKGMSEIKGLSYTQWLDYCEEKYGIKQ
jgi:hypothetical protein